MSLHLDPKYDDHSEESRRSRRYQERRYRRDSTASGIWVMLGVLLAAVLCFAFMGPRTIVVNSGNGCCCYSEPCSNPCKPAGEAHPPTRGDRIGGTVPVEPLPALPPAETYPAPYTLPDPQTAPESRTAFAPVPIPGGSGGGGSGTTPQVCEKPFPDEPDKPEGTVPEPGTIAMIAIGLAALWKNFA